MTEITKIPEIQSPLWPRHRPARYLIDPVAFTAAFVGAPLLVALLGCWLVIPVYAVLFGAPFYILLGAPAFILMLRRQEPTGGNLALAGFVANLLGPVLSIPFFLHEGQSSPGGIVTFFLIFGSIFAPIWGAVFALLYRRMRRAFYAQPL